MLTVVWLLRHHVALLNGAANRACTGVSHPQEARRGLCAVKTKDARILVYAITAYLEENRGIEPQRFRVNLSSKQFPSQTELLSMVAQGWSRTSIF